jgi:uncharacterized membrane protein
MKELVKVLFRFGKTTSLFIYKGNVYEIPNEYAFSVAEKIKEKIKEYKKIKYSLLNDAAALGAIITPITLSGEDPFKLELENNIKRILDKYSISKLETLEKYL